MGTGQSGEKTVYLIKNNTARCVNRETNAQERLTMADIEIRMLGKFEILMDGKPVLAALKQSRKATMLIQYLVLQKGERVTHKDLTDTLSRLFSSVTSFSSCSVITDEKSNPSLFQSFRFRKTHHHNWNQTNGDRNENRHQHRFKKLC